MWVMALLTLDVKYGLMDDTSLRLGVTEATQLGFRDDQLVGVFLKIVSKVACFALLLSVGPMKYPAGHLLGVALRRDARVDRTGRPLDLRLGFRSVGPFQFVRLHRFISVWCRGVPGVGCDLWRGLSWGVRTAGRHGDQCNAPTT